MTSEARYVFRFETYDSNYICYIVIISDKAEKWVAPQVGIEPMTSRHSDEAHCHSDIPRLVPSVPLSLLPTGLRMDLQCCPCREEEGRDASR